MTLRDLIARVPPKPDPNKYGNSFAGDAAYNEDALHHAISQLAVAEAALREARDYIEANGGGWCRDGVTAPEVMRDIDAVIEAMGK